MPQDTALLRLRIAKLRAAILTVQLAKGDGHVPPEGVRSAARRGLEARKKWGRGGLSNTEASDQGIGSGVQRAANLANGDAVSTETVRRMHAFFSRHAKNYRPDAKEADGGPTAGTIAWWLWGGNAGKAWAAGIVAAEDRKDLRKRVDALVAKISRWPAGAPGKKGGQFAPAKGGAGGGFAAPQLGLSGPLSASSGGGGSGAQGSLWSASSAPKGPPPGAKPHPAGFDDKGKPVTINYPSKPSAPETWADPEKVATFVPGGDTPAALNGVAFRPWKPPADDAGWATVAGQNARIDEDPFEPAPGKGVGTGVVVVEPDGRVWLTKPTNEFGGYQHTFPKGTMEPGLPMQANAIKEAYEETGLKVEITGVLGDFERTTSKARYYVARRVSGTPKDMGWETQAMRLAPVGKLKSLLNMGVDKAITDAMQAEIEVGGSLAKAKGLLARARVLLAKAKAAAPGGPAKPGGAWEKQPRWPAGTPVGGQFKAYDGAGIPTPPAKIGSSSNPGPQKSAQALYALAVDNNLQALKDYAAKNAPKLDAWNQGGGKGLNSQAKWAAMNAYYAGALVDTLQAKPKAVAAATKIAGGPEKVSDMNQIAAKPGGSNPGAIYFDMKGQQEWLVKGNAKLVQGAVTQAQSDDRAKNEVLASKLIAAVGAGTVEMKLVDLEDKHGGGLGVAGKMLEGFEKLNTSKAAHLAAAQADFAVHAWLGNYDVLGMGADNTVIKDGKAINIDPGGAILFRAQGLPKDSFGPKADEWDSMRTTTPEQKAVYGKMTASQLQESAKKLQGIDEDTIKKLVDAHGPGDAAAKAKLAQTLIARRDDILTRAGLKGTATKPSDDDLIALFSTANAAAAAPKAGPTIDPDAIKASLQAASADAKAKIDALNAKQYKENKTVVEFSGDGPGKSPFKSIGGINAAKKKKAIAAHSATIQAVNDIMGKMNAPGGAEQMAALISQTLADAKKNVASGTSIFSTVKQSFEYSILDKLGFKAKYGAVLSNDVSKLLYAMAEGSPPPVAAPAAAPAAKPAAKPAAQNFGMFASLKADIDDAVKTGDKSALDGVKAYLSAPQNKNEPGSAEMLAYLQSQTSGAPVRAPAPAAAPAPTAAAPATAAVPPTFNTGLKSDGYYTDLVAKTEALYLAGDAAGLKAMVSEKATNTWGGKTPSSKKLVGFHAALVADLEAKAQKQQAATIQAAQEAIAKPATVAQARAVAQAKVVASMPNFDGAKLPTSNSNAASHNAKVDTIKQLADAGDLKGLISLNYGTNTYGKKQAQLANDALAALGSDLKVVAGQKANTHPSLTGGIPAPQAAAALASVGAAAPAPHPATKAAVDTSKIDTSKSNLPPVPSFGKSTKPWVNQQNAELSAKIKALFDAGNLDALRGLTYDKLDKETGQPIGKGHISDHPAKDLQSFYGAAVAQMEAILNPPRPFKPFTATKASSLDAVAKSFPTKPFGTTVKKAKSNEQLGYWIALGKVSDPASFMPKKLMDVSDADKAKAYEDYKKADKLTKAFITGIQASGSYNDLFRTGKQQDGAGNDLRAVAKAATAYAQTKPPGTSIYRWQHMPDEMIEKLFQSGPGTIYQDAGSACTSMSPTATKHFGPHRVRIVFAPGAKAVDSFGSGSFASEQEITYLPNSRFMIQEVKKIPNDNKNYPGVKERVELVVLMLPPDDV